MKALYQILGLFFLVTTMTMGTAAAQSFAFGVKGGGIMGLQRGAGSLSSVLFGGHGILYIESLPAGNDYAVFAQAGYHQRGSAQQRRFGFTNLAQSLFPREYVFNNAALSLGFKQKYDWGNRKAYYLLGLRGEYTISHNLQEVFDAVTSIQNTNPNSNFNPLFYYPLPGGVRDFNYGFIAGAGIEFEFSDLVGGLIELTFNPDLSPQLRQFPLELTDPQTGNARTLPEWRFYNTTLELTVGIRLLRVVEYID